jgi:hypothetical protein
MKSGHHFPVPADFERSKFFNTHLRKRDTQFIDSVFEAQIKIGWVICCEEYNLKRQTDSSIKDASSLVKPYVKEIKNEKDEVVDFEILSSSLQKMVALFQKLGYDFVYACIDPSREDLENTFDLIRQECSSHPDNKFFVHTYYTGHSAQAYDFCEAILNSKLGMDQTYELEQELWNLSKEENVFCCLFWEGCRIQKQAKGGSKSYNVYQKEHETSNHNYFGTYAVKKGQACKINYFTHDAYQKCLLEKL